MNYDEMREGLEIDKLVGLALGGLHAKYAELCVPKEYSTEAYQCLSLMQMMQQRGHDLITWYSRDERKWCAAVGTWGAYYDENVIDTNIDHLSEADTLPLAVCRTVLKALDAD